MKSTKTAKFIVLENFSLYGILHAYIITAVKNILSKKTIKSFAELSKEIVETYLNIKILTKPSTGTGSETDGVCKDKMFLYAREVILSLCLLWHGYHDAISEGDGDRMFSKMRAERTTA